ncbi:hypothetical protein [Nocardioides sp.]|uniref:hypothetical protein n=1 Tax=Nocardioides sp. TaxID=35761 RepID=UPI00321A29A5
MELPRPLLAAAAAVIGAAGLTSCSGEVTASPRVPPSSATTTAIPSAAPSPTQVPIGPRLADLPRGRDPKVGYVDGGTFVAPGGRRNALPDRYGISSVTSFDGGFLVADTRFFEGTSGLVRVTARGREDLGPCTSGAGAVSGDRELVAWATFACPESGEPAPLVIHRYSSRGLQSQRVASQPGHLTQVVGFIGHDVVYQSTFTGGVFVTDLVHPPAPVAGLRTVSGIDETGDRLAGALPRRGPVGAVVDRESGRTRWTVRGVYLGDFSPHGSLVLGQRRAWLVLDARTGAERGRIFEAFDAGAVVWEDDRHLLAVVREGGMQAIVRTDLRGRTTLASDLVRRDRPGEQRFVLAQQP